MLKIVFGGEAVASPPFLVNTVSGQRHWKVPLAVFFTDVRWILPLSPTSYIVVYDETHEAEQVTIGSKFVEVTPYSGEITVHRRFATPTVLVAIPEDAVDFFYAAPRVQVFRTPGYGLTGTVTRYGKTRIFPPVKPYSMASKLPIRVQKRIEAYHNEPYRFVTITCRQRQINLEFSHSDLERLTGIDANFGDECVIRFLSTGVVAAFPENCFVSSFQC